MEYAKELLEELASRSRSHFFGSIALSFLAFNWQPLYFVIYANVDIIDRFEYFNHDVRLWQPIIVGILLALAAPILTLFGSIWAQNFTTRMKKSQNAAADDIQKHKDKLRQKRATATVERGQELDAELEKIEDEEVREKVRDDALSEEQLSSARSTKELNNALISMTRAERYLLSRMYDSNGGILTISKDFGKKLVLINGQPLKDSPESVYETAADELARAEYIMSMVTHNNQVQIFQLTDAGRWAANGLRENSIA